MKRILILAAVLAVAAPAFAGEGKKCTASTQECLDYMAKSYAKRGWIGIEADPIDAGWKIEKVVAGSPAEKAGIQAGDVFVSANGIKYSEEDSEKQAELQKQMVAGALFTFLVARGDSEMEVPVTLGEMPEEVLVKMVGKHMIEHASVQAEEE